MEFSFKPSNRILYKKCPSSPLINQDSDLIIECYRVPLLMQNQALYSAFLTIVPFHPEHCWYLLWLEIIVVLGRASGGSARAVKLEQMTYKGPFQPQLLCDSVILWKSEYFRSLTILHALLLINQNIFFFTSELIIIVRYV